MKTEMTWNEFCELYFDTAKKAAEIYLQKQKNKLGQINPRVDLDYVRDTAVLSAMEKAYAKYDSSKGAKITTFLSTLVHNSIVDTLEKESKEAAKQQDIDDVKTIIKDIAEEGSDGSEARKKLIPRLREAIDKLSPSDQIILFHYLADKKNYVAKSAEALQVSENYVSVRRNRIFKQLPQRTAGNTVGGRCIYNIQALASALHYGHMAVASRRFLHRMPHPRAVAHKQ